MMEDQFFSLVIIHCWYKYYRFLHPESMFYVFQLRVYIGKFSIATCLKFIIEIILKSSVTADLIRMQCTIGF